MTEPDEVVRIMNGVARVLQGASDLDDTLTATTQAVLGAVAAAEHASLWLVRRDNSPSSVAPTGAPAADADAYQLALRQGPATDALAGQATVWSNDLGHDGRWPVYGAKVTDHGIRSQLSVHLASGDDSLGTLNVYSSQAGAFSDDDRMLAELSATRAAAALSFATTLEQLTDALSARTSIGTALGIVMERYSLDEQQAFQYLVRLSQTGNVKLRQVAQRLVESTGDQAAP